MNVEQTLQSEIQYSNRWIECTQEDNTYKRNPKKRIELINQASEDMKNPDFQICALLETRMNKIIDEINKKDSNLLTQDLLVSSDLMPYINRVYASC